MTTIYGQCMGTCFTIDNERKQLPFIAPDGYFDSFAVRQKFTLTDELKQLPYTVADSYFETFAVRCETLSLEPLARQSQWKQQPYTVPEGYFSDLPLRIADSIGEVARPKIRRWRTLRTQVAVAASFLLLLFTGYGVFSTYQQSLPVSITEDPLIGIVLAYPNIDEHSLMKMAVEDDDESASDALNDDAIIHYLATTNLNLADIAALY